jgi:nucleotide-binding universal stress UspA family protein
MASKLQILVPTDFSEQSMIALGQSYNLARLNNAAITLLYVIEEENAFLPFMKKSYSEEKKLIKQIKEKLTEISTQASKASGVKVNVKIEKGKIYEQIVKVAEEINAIFIIMGTSGSSGIKKFIGSNTLRIVRESKCPVITIKGKTHRSGCKNIVLPLDLTRETKEKVNKAIEIAKHFNSDIRIVTVLVSNDEFLVKKLKRQLNQVQEFVANKGVNCTAESIKGNNVAEEIVNYAEKIDADLIMIMTQEESDWTDLFIGSQAQQVINSTDVPVLSIRPSEKTDMTVFTPY